MIKKTTIILNESNSKLNDISLNEEKKKEQKQNNGIKKIKNDINAYNKEVEEEGLILKDSRMF